MIGGQTDRQISDGQTCRQRQEYVQTDELLDRQADRQMNLLTDRLTDRQTKSAVHKVI